MSRALLPPRLPVLLACLLAVGWIGAQPAPEQTVWLKNGGFVRGTLVELVPGEHVTVQLVTGEIRKIPAREIDRMHTSAASPMAQPSAAPSSLASAPLPVPVPTPTGMASTVTLRVVAPAGVEIQERPRLEKGPWGTLCLAPCDQTILVIDREFRAGGPNVHPSHTFVLEPGERPVRVEVNPGRADLHRWGTLAYLVGLPVTLVGGVGIGIDLGTNLKHNETIGTIGLVTVMLGGALLISSLPLLYAGQTRVVNDKGVQIGKRRPDTLFLHRACGGLAEGLREG
ncbi:MAG: hypothetical protein RMJ98_15035 [Myxococcales bacterium]|nr:hypothetical protein [Polyangiaceae bacterium]MDW8250607.1 hypothetical protein [Myxococcales bacterium]